MQEIFIYFDDSGTLHRNASGRYFIYAGYIFTSKIEMDVALAHYVAAEENLRNRKRKDNSPSIELKASILSGKQKRFLNSVLKDYESVACIVDKRRVHDSILDRKLSIHRFKDYRLKRTVKEKMVELIHNKIIDPNKPTILRLYIDNQPTTSDGFYTLQEGILEEFSHGVRNFDYATFYPPIFNNSLKVVVKFCDSKTQPLVRACDILANSYWTKLNFYHTQTVKTERAKEVYLP